MRSIKESDSFATLNFPGLTRELETGRLVATVGDTSRGLYLHHEQVRRAAGRTYQDGYLVDVLDVIANRKKTPGRGRPRKHPKGIVLADLETLSDVDQ